MGASPVWHKSTYSGGTGSECVEVARSRSQVLVRDSKQPCGPILRFSAGAWAGLLDHTWLRTGHASAPAS
ncbi:hypothetical protein B6E66_15540 [Streptomyces maremycinicus]|nr:hypothetical protein B6E66_15540 [Streptomyces sp. B9173]